MNQPVQKSGFALVVVLAVIALAAVLGYALLSTAALSSQIGRNAKSMVASDALAESGTELAMYYLQRPEKAPSLNSAGHWAGGNNIFLGNGLSIDTVTVTQVAPKTFSIASTAGGGAARTINSTVHVESTYQVKHALAGNSSMDLSRCTLSVTGTVSPISIRVDGTLTLASPLLCTLMTLGSNQTGWIAPPTYPVRAVPLASEASLMQSLPNYVYNGKLCTADEFDAVSINAASAPDPVRNPANVWYVKDGCQAPSSGSLAGTLVILGSNGDLDVTGALTITPQPGMPALIVARDLKLSTNTARLEANGLIWVGQCISSAQGAVISEILVKPVLQINGALMLANTNSGCDPAANFRGELKLNFTPANLMLPDFSEVGQAATGIRVLTWK